MKNAARCLAAAAVLLLLPTTNASEWPAPAGSLQPADSRSSEFLFVRSGRFTPRMWPAALPLVCSDADGDGYSPDGGTCGPLDCDDFDAGVSPGAPEVCDGLDNNCDGAIEPRFLDKDGEEFCLSIVVAAGVVGAPVPATVHGYHQSGVARLRLVAPDSGEATGFNFDCGLSLYCQFDTTVPASSYPGVYSVGATLEKGPVLAAVAWTSQRLDVACPGEYCDPDPLWADLIAWMRLKGYLESIVSRYAELRFWYEDLPYWEVPLAKMRSELRRRLAGFIQPLVLTFHDLIPTDTEATYIAMGPGEGPPCEPSNSFDDWCDPPTATDFEFVEAHFEQTFGVDFEFIYQRTDMDYSEVRGEPELIDGSMYRFPFTHTFNSQFHYPDIVHSAMETWKGLPVDRLTTGQHAAFCQLPAHTLTRITTYTHEWGHTANVGHPFHSSDTGRVFWRLNGVMDNSYRLNIPPLLDMTDPFERYALEPQGGYQDDATFAATYNDYIIGSLQMPQCGLVDPAILDVAVLAQTPADITYRLTLGNSGNVPVSFVKLAAFDGDPLGALVEERWIDRLPPGAVVTHDFTISRAALTSDSAVFVLDPADEIKGLSDHPESACPNPIQCADVNNDGIVANLADVVVMVPYVFKSGPPPSPVWTADFQSTSPGVSAADIIYLINHIFRAGPAPICHSPGI